MPAKEIQEVLDREKPWFDLARMVLTALGFAIACFVGVKHEIEIHQNWYDLTVRLMPLVAPVCFSVFLCLRIIVVVRRIGDTLLPPLAKSQRTMWHPVQILYIVALLLIALSANGIIYLAAAALSHQ